MDQVFRNRKAIAIFVLPALILFTLVGFYPILQSFYYSLLDWDGIQAGTFVGLANYIDLFVTDTNHLNFVHSLVNSIWLALASIFIQLPIALLLALILARGIKGEQLYRTIYFIPVLVSSAVIGMLFQRFYNPNYGLINTVLKQMGLESWSHDWLVDPHTALISICIPIIWQYIGYHMLLMYAAIKGISEDLYEAAKIDGASAVRSVFSITIPLIVPILRVCIIFAVLGSLKLFDLVYIMTSGRTSSATDVPSTLMYSTIFNRFMYGYGSAMAIFMVIECLFFYLVLQWLIRTREEREGLQ
ncbi:sugar ABC transporter permease [Paenibacillus hunanensis]|uniref:carbohydrate ABC transporter permease n=1 Tax=Paenibacillus hunanensis TaxID=539262 RepID=UPI00202735B5|nr:sugar ABC transporter permease [Paenibacillus hunanensis]MCL9661970.1 sugar ABC transporter permease [Paenibacillus hunanensis]